jgi:hypothetical protein
MSGFVFAVGFDVQREIPNKDAPLHVKPDRITANVTTCKVQGLFGWLTAVSRPQKRT